MTATASHDQLSRLLDLQDGAERCPHLGWATVRAQGRVVWIPRLGAFAVTHYDDVAEVLGDPDRFASGLGNPRGPLIGVRLAEVRARLAETSAEFRDLLSRMQPDWRAEQVLLSADGAQHSRHRALVVGMFSARRAAALEPWIREQAEDVLGAFADQQVVELFRAFCMALPVRVIADQLGMDRSKIEDFLRWSVHANAQMGNDFFTDDDVIEHTRCNVEFSEYFRPLMAARRADPRDDFVTKIAVADDEEFELNEERRLAIISQTLNAGHETSSKTMAEAVSLLARDPEMAARLRADPSRIPTLVEEALRLASPTQGLYRTVARDTTLGGVELPAGVPLLVLYASANRDDAQFPDPDDADVDRRNAGTNLAFGRGKHFCPGAALARVVVRVGLEVLLERMPPWSIAADQGLGGGEVFNPSYLLHGRNELWVRFGA